MQTPSAIDAAGDVWVAFVDGGLLSPSRGCLAEKKKKKKKRRARGLPEIRPTVVTSDASGRLWLGYRSNQVAIIENGRVTSLGEREGLQLGTIAVINVGRYVLMGGDRGLGLLQADRVRTLRAADPTTVDVPVSRNSPGTNNGDVWLNNWAWRRAYRRGRDEKKKSSQQDASHELTVEVFDRRRRLSGARHHESRALAAHHDDGERWAHLDRRSNT